MTQWARFSAVLFSFFLFSSIACAEPGNNKILWLGQSAVRITSASGKVIVVDPWLTTNPRTPERYKALETLGKVDLILVTHGHGDHIADAPALARLTGAKVYGPADLVQSAVALGMLAPDQVGRFNKGGPISPLPGIKVTATHAEHSSVLVWKNPTTGKDEVHDGGEPVGFVIELENGFKVYHMGDTGLFGDMRLIAQRYKPDLVLIPIGGHFTMDPADAAFATREYLKPKYVIPIHYGANPLIMRTPDEYIKALGRTRTKVLALSPGDEIAF